LDIEYPFNSQCADDFILEDDSRVTGVHWWGVFWEGYPPYPNSTDFNIIFYADDGTGDMPTGAGMYDPTSTALAVYFIPQVTGIPFGTYDGNFEYNITLPEPFNVTADTKYWIAIQAVFPWPPQWGWWTNGNNPDQLHAPVQGLPIMGVPYWTELTHGDMAFYLTGHLNIPPSPPIIHGESDGDVNIEYDFWTDPIIDPSGNSTYIRWDWDDGNITDWLGPYSSGSNASASHSWTQGGIYEIRAQLQGIGGQSNWSDPHSILIFQNTPPIANFTYTIDELTISLDASSSYDPDGVITTWLWDFGDGTEGTGEILTHTYQTSGTYTVILTVTDDYGDTATITKHLSVEKYQKVFIVGRLQNTTYIGDTIEFSAINLKVITFRPFTYVNYKSGEHIIILNPYTGHLGYRFIFASCLKRV
jgi:PKD repeat protein